MPWHQGSVFILGPPVQRTEVEPLVQQVLECVLDRPVWHFSLDALKGPVFYLCSWMTGGRTSVRPGLKGVELFCGTAWWESHQPTPESFTVSVADVDFFGRCAEHRENRTPDFETFLVAMFTGNAVKPSSVFEWMASAKRGWFDRSAWLPQWTAIESERQRVKSLEALNESCWHDFLDINKLFALFVDQSSRRQRGSKGKKGGTVFFFAVLLVSHYIRAT